MDRTTVERQQIIEAVGTFPEGALAELASVLDYLHYKSAQRREVNSRSASFLLQLQAWATLVNRMFQSGMKKSSAMKLILWMAGVPSRAIRDDGDTRHQFFVRANQSRRCPKTSHFVST